MAFRSRPRRALPVLHRNCGKACGKTCGELRTRPHQIELHSGLHHHGAFAGEYTLTAARRPPARPSRPPLCRRACRVRLPGYSFSRSGLSSCKSSLPIICLPPLPTCSARVPDGRSTRAPAAAAPSCSRDLADADALIVRSATQVDARPDRSRAEAARDRPRRHRRRQRRRPGRDRARHPRDERARRQQHQRRRARDGAHARACPADSRAPTRR